MIHVVNYVTAEGIDPFDRWLRRQNTEVRARVQTRIDRVEVGNFGDIQLAQAYWSDYLQEQQNARDSA